MKRELSLQIRKELGMCRNIDEALAVLAYSEADNRRYVASQAIWGLKDQIAKVNQPEEDAEIEAIKTGRKLNPTVLYGLSMPEPRIRLSAEIVAHDKAGIRKSLDGEDLVWDTTYKSAYEQFLKDHLSVVEIQDPEEQE